MLSRWTKPKVNNSVGDNRAEHLRKDENGHLKQPLGNGRNINQSTERGDGILRENIVTNTF